MINQIGVIGAGLMGNGIAHVAAMAGCDVILSDVAMNRAEKGKATIEANLGRQLAKAQISEAEMQAALKRITLTIDTATFAACDLVIEAATENESLKQKVFADLCSKISKDCLIASNTSSISITRLASYTDRPDKFLGMHFFNPVPLMKLVEIIPGIATAKTTTAAITEAAQRMGKITVEAADSPSFIVNRILVPMLNEAIFALGEGVGSVEDIDAGMKLGANHPMGPLTLCDFIGLDTTLAVMRVI
jgi:3-hydroxybutyryl-CoA dehydrogenase